MCRHIRTNLMWINDQYDIPWRLMHILNWNIYIICKVKDMNCREFVQDYFSVCFCEEQLLAINFILCLLDLILVCSIHIICLHFFSCLLYWCQLFVVVTPLSANPLLPPRTFWLPTFRTNLEVVWDIAMPHNRNFTVYMDTRLR